MCAPPRQALPVFPENVTFFDLNAHVQPRLCEDQHFVDVRQSARAKSPSACRTASRRRAARATGLLLFAASRRHGELEHVAAEPRGRQQHGVVIERDR